MMKTKSVCMIVKITDYWREMNLEISTMMRKVSIIYKKTGKVTIQWKDTMNITGMIQITVVEVQNFQKENTMMEIRYGNSPHYAPSVTSDMSSLYTVGLTGKENS